MTEPRAPGTSSGEDPTQPAEVAIPPLSPGPEADAPSVSWQPAAGPPPPATGGKRRGLFLTIVLVVAAAVGAVGIRFIGQQAASFLGSSFAGDDVWRRLPTDAQQEYERRIKAAASDLESLSDAERGRQLQARVVAGMRRLEDAVLVRRLTLQTLALGKVDDATCGQFAQASFGGLPQPEGVALKLMGAMSDPELREWFSVVVLALEAEVRKSPEARSIPDAEANAAFERLLGSIDDATLQQIQTGATQGASSAEACSGARAMYDAIELLPDPDRRLIALADVAL